MVINENYKRIKSEMKAARIDLKKGYISFQEYDDWMEELTRSGKRIISFSTI